MQDEGLTTRLRSFGKSARRFSEPINSLLRPNNKDKRVLGQFPGSARFVNSRGKILLAVGTVILTVTYFALPPILERIYGVERWLPPWETYVVASAANAQNESTHTPIAYAGYVSRDTIERLRLNQGQILVLRWTAGKLWWEDKAIETSELAPYVTGLLRAKACRGILVVIAPKSEFGDVVGALDKLQYVDAHAIWYCMEPQK